MSELFLKVVNMSISAGWLVLAVLACRLLLKKAPKWVYVLLWGIVAVRLICPFSIESAVSLIPSAETISPDIMMDPAPSVSTGIPALNSAVNPVISQSFTPSPAASANPLQIWIPVFAIVWLAGVAVLLAYTAVSYWRLRRKVDTAVRFRDNIFQSENAASPFVLGVVRPKIYLPFGMDGRDMENVVAHELAHIRRRDHWWKPLGFLLLTVHWFNPLMWLAYVLLCRDIELACDEKVIRELGNEQRADYTQALLACSVSRRAIAACPLAFGEVGVKERVKSVMTYKKPTFGAVVLAVIACAVVAMCFLTDPNGNISAEEAENILREYLVSVNKWELNYVLEPLDPVLGEIENEEIFRFEIRYTDDTDEVGSRLIDNYAITTDGEKIFWYNSADDEFVQRERKLLNSFILGLDKTDTKAALTLDDVTALSQRGYELSWADFEGFNHSDVGSGLYIWKFEISQMFTLMVGGGSLNVSPMYIDLTANDGTHSRIDIRDGGVAEYIELHKDNPLVVPCTAGYQCSAVGHTGELFAKMIELGGASYRLQLSSIQYLPVVRIDNREELEAFTELISSYENLDLDYSYPDTVSFNDAVKAYDDSFFETSTLFLVCVPEPGVGYRHNLEYVEMSNGTLSISIQKYVETVGYILEDWLIAVSVPTAQIAGVEEVEAHISSQYYPDEDTGVLWREEG